MGSKNRHGKKEESAAFDQAALNKLTGKIDQDLSRSSEPSAGKGKRKRHDAVTPGPKPKKRQLNEEGRNSEEKSSQSKKPRPGAITRDALLEEIRALGGDEDDLELIANVDSDADEESQVKPKPGAENQIDSKLKRELAKFASSLGFQNLSDGHDIEPEESAHEKDDRAACKDADSPKDTEEEPQEETTLVKESTGKSRKGKTVSRQSPHNVMIAADS